MSSSLTTGDEHTTIATTRRPSVDQQTLHVKKFLEEHVLFKGLDDKFLTTLSTAMQSRIYNPGEFVVRKGEIGKAMFFVLRGEVEVISEDASCRAFGRCMILALTKERLQRVLKLYPKVNEAISILAEERYQAHMKQQQAAMKVDFEDEINLSVTNKDLKKIPLFRDCDIKFLHQLALKLNPLQYRRGETIIQKGDIATEMYFVVGGIAEVYSEETDAIFAEFHPGTFFGEVGIFLEVKRIASVRAQSSIITVFKLSKNDLEEVMTPYPAISTKINEEAKQRFELNKIREKNKLNTMQEAVTEVDVLRETLKQIPLFKGGSQAFFHELAMALKLRVFQPKELIIIADEPGSSMFFVADGIADVVSKNGQTVYGEFGSSSFFGEVALFYVINRTATIRARTVCTTLELHKDSLRAILAQHESLARTMLLKAEENYKLAIERQKAVKKLQEGAGDTTKFTIEDTIDRLSKVPTFQKTNKNFIRTMAQYTSVHRYKRGEMICKKGDIANEMYFVVSGQVEIVSDDGTQIFDTVKDGDFFGEVGLLRNTPRTASVRISTATCDVIQLNKTALETVLNEFPDSFQSIAIEADKRLQQVVSRNAAAVENMLHHVEESSVAGKGVNQDILRKFVLPFSKKPKSTTTPLGEVPADKKGHLNSIFRTGGKLGVDKKDSLGSGRSSVVGLNESLGSSTESLGSNFDGLKRRMSERDMGKFGKMLTKVFGNNSKKEEKNLIAKVAPLAPAKSQKESNVSSYKKIQHIYEVPAGIIASALQYLNPKERLKMRILGQKFNAIISDSSCWQIADDELGIMTNTCPNVQSICLSNCWKITDRGISYMAYGLTKMRAIDVSYCGQLKGVGFSDHRWSNLRSINLTHCKQIGDEQLEKILAPASEIEVIKVRRKISSIDLSDCDHVSDKCLKWIASSPSKLSELRLSFCTRLTNAGLYDLSLGHHAFETLDFSHCQQITDASVVFFTEIMKHLKFLGLRRCRKITDGLASFLAKNALQLKCVDLTGCPLITNISKRILGSAIAGINVLIDIPREARNVKSPEEAGKPRAVEMLITQVYTSGPKDMGKIVKKKEKKEKKGRRKSAAAE
ncbi:hypothetical protein HK100_012910 [Physocladia obscura]|uniref:Cyclic nucleotide-binding domain-containing protein n=1 Tax=Physocladia obscura TaxID=109957 RepID=A0AAD5T039_9FUNG|nr:hypothetical protein HK100_012910 [Physocladia obscura]